jgi:putative sigma-54 modulation protein
MEIAIRSIHFESSQKLEEFIQKKVSRLAKFNDNVHLAEVSLKVVKPETNENKDASVKLFSKGHEFFAQEVANTFEEAVDKCVEKLERQIVKYKEKLISPK